LSDNKNIQLLKTMFERQDEFSSLFFDKSEMTEHQKEEMTKSFALALHAEATGLATSVNFKDHRLVKHDIDKNKILYKSVDAFRYLLATLNLWEFNTSDFVGAFWDKDLYLHMRHKMEKNKWNGQPVILVDLDDVLNEFRECFTDWLNEERGIFVSPDSTEYYSTKEVKEAGFLPEGVFQEFIEERQLRYISRNEKMIDVINKLHDEGYWIQIITARPSDNLLCLYDTYHWLHHSGLNFHNLDFSPEKFRWLVQKDFYDADAVVCAIDDSAKHSSEYAKHGIDVLSPVKSYNKELENTLKVTMYNDVSNVYNLVRNLTKRKV
jgi:hypothetical protein